MSSQQDGYQIYQNNFIYLYRQNIFNNPMKHILPILLFAICGIASSQVSDNSQSGQANILPIRGFCIAAPQPKDLDEYRDLFLSVPHSYYPFYHMISSGSG